MMDSPTRRGSDPLEGLGVRLGAQESVIDRESYFEGTYRTPGSLRIEGRFEGAIECQGTLVVAEGAQVNARVMAGNMTVAGTLAGEGQCLERFEILRTGRVSGTMVAKSVVVHDGAFFEGEIHMGTGPMPAAVGRAPEPATRPGRTPARAATPVRATQPSAPPPVSPTPAPPQTAPTVEIPVDDSTSNGTGDVSARANGKAARAPYD